MIYNHIILKSPNHETEHRSKIRGRTYSKHHYQPMTIAVRMESGALDINYKSQDAVRRIFE